MKVLIIGLGSIARKHIEALLEIDNEISIYALRSKVNSEVYKSVINIYTLSNVENIKFDFCIISSPTYLHTADILRVIPLNIPLFIEKPISHVLDLEEVVDAINSKNISTYVACNLRFLDSLIFLKDYLKKEKLVVNELNVYCGSYLPDWRPGRDYKDIYSADDEKGGGVHLDMIHELDYVYWLFGAPNKVHSILRSNSSLNIKAVDYAQYNLEYPNFVANVKLNYFRRKARRYLELVAQNYTLKVEILRNSVYADDELIYKSEQTVQDTYLNQMEYFINNLSEKMQNDINEAKEVLEICLRK